MTSYTLDSIVREYLIMQGKDAMHEYPRTLQAAISTLKDLNYDVSGVPKVVSLEITDSTRAVLPQDVVRVIRMGFSNQNGEFVEIFSDNKLIIGLDDNTISHKEYGYPSAPNTVSDMVRNGEVIGRQYGNVGGSAYKFRMDWDRGLVEFSSNVSGDVILEYLSDPSKVGAQYEVHPFLVDAIQLGLHHRLMKFKRSYAPQEKQIAFRDYLNAKHHAKVRFASESLGSMYNASRKTINQSIKY